MPPPCLLHGPGHSADERQQSITALENFQLVRFAPVSRTREMFTPPNEATMQSSHESTDYAREASKATRALHRGGASDPTDRL